MSLLGNSPTTAGAEKVTLRYSLEFGARKLLPEKNKQKKKKAKSNRPRREVKT